MFFNTDHFVVGIIMVISLVIAPASLLLTPFQGDGPALVIVPPWVEIEHVLDQAHLTEISPIRAPFGVLVSVDSGNALKNLKGLGIWAILDGKIIAEICGVTNV